MANCEICGREFQIKSRGCSRHFYKNGYNEEYYNLTHKNGLWKPPIDLETVLEEIDEGWEAQIQGGKPRPRRLKRKRATG
jgi:hypothetical protein